MRLSAKTEYAALAALALARRWNRDEPLSIRAISTTEQVPERFLVHILLQLKAAGLVTSIRGAGGGYHLSRPPREITLDDIHAAIEGRPDSIAPITGDLARRSRAAAVPGPRGRLPPLATAARARRRRTGSRARPR